MASDLWKWNLGDFEKGLLVAVLSAVLTVVYDTAQTGTINFDYQKILTVGITAAAAYLLKNLATGSSGKILNEPKKQPEVK